MTINIFILKGDLNGKIIVVRFFFLPGKKVSHVGTSMCIKML